VALHRSTAGIADEKSLNGEAACRRSLGPRSRTDRSSVGRFKRYEQASATLSDPAARAAYDLARRE
jgi:hypothetical protein